MSSDDEDDIVVMQVCNNTGCTSMNDVKYDVESDQMFCGECRALFMRAEKEGFHILLSRDDLALVEMIFDTFDSHQKGFWTFEDYNKYADETGENRDENVTVSSAEDLEEHFHAEYDINVPAGELTQRHLQNMYGGYMYNGQTALRDDAEVLGEKGLMSLAALE